jgi:methylmalonyl-CoA mutase cobalamin-binding domain/chain
VNERGPQGRIVVGTLGLDQHEVGAMAVAKLLMRHGFEVVYLGRFNTPEHMASAAESEDAEVIGVSIHSWELTAYLEDLLAGARRVGAAVVVGGAVLTEEDRETLTARGIDAVFGPWAGEQEIVAAVRTLVARVRAERDADGAQGLPG